MKATKIKAKLIEKGITITSIADTLGVSQPTVSLTIAGKTVSARVRQAIADAIGKDVDDVWPPQEKAA